MWIFLLCITIFILCITSMALVHITSSLWSCPVPSQLHACYYCNTDALSIWRKWINKLWVLSFFLFYLYLFTTRSQYIKKTTCITKGTTRRSYISFIFSINHDKVHQNTGIMHNWVIRSRIRKSVNTVLSYRAVEKEYYKEGCF